MIKYLHVNKAHGHDDSSVRMIKLCGQSIVKPLAIVFKNCFDNSIFPDIRKESNIIAVFSIVHDISASFDCRPSLEFRGIFLDKSKAFDQV